jgi:hypothetical protein
VRMAASYVIALAMGLLISIAYDRDWVITAINRVSFLTVSKTSQDHPFLYVLRSSFTCTGVRRIDAREDKTQVFTKAMLRANIKDYGTVEGFVRVYPTELDPDQVFLSPACKMEAMMAKPILGPGVLVQAKNVVAWIDATASECWNVHYGETLPCLCPSSELSDKYMERMNQGRLNQAKYKQCRADQ